jgi:EamA domain-containing membrane protein RarD
MSYPAAPANDKTTLWGVLGIVLGFFCCPIVGFVFGYLSLRESKKYGTKPTLAYVAFVLSAVSIVINIILVSTHNYPGLR